MSLIIKTTTTSATVELQHIGRPSLLNLNVILHKKDGSYTGLTNVNPDNYVTNPEDYELDKASANFKFGFQDY